MDLTCRVLHTKSLFSSPHTLCAATTNTSTRNTNTMDSQILPNAVEYWLTPLSRFSSPDQFIPAAASLRPGPRLPAENAIKTSLSNCSQKSATPYPTLTCHRQKHASVMLTTCKIKGTFRIFLNKFLWSCFFACQKINGEIPGYNLLTWLWKVCLSVSKMSHETTWSIWIKLLYKMAFSDTGCF